MVKSYFGVKNNQKVMDKKILVTGSTGLIGSHVLYNLVSKDFKVRAFYRDAKKLDKVKKVLSYYSDDYERLFGNIEWVQVDLLDVSSLDDAIKGISKVYHCAAMVAIGGKNKDELIQNNVTATENIVNLSIQHGVDKLCHVSSVAALGGPVNGEFITEESKWTSTKNHSAYAVSKFKSEMEVWRGIQEGLKAVIVNPSVVIGPGFWNSGSGSLFTRAAKETKYYTTGKTGFVDVRDVARAMVELMESDISEERFILNSENVSYKDLFSKVAAAMNVKQPKKPATKKMLKTISALEYLMSGLGLKRRELTKDVVRASFSESNYLNEKIKKALGFKFRSIKDSIEDTTEKYKKDLTIS